MNSLADAVRAVCFAACMAGHSSARALGEAVLAVQAAVLEAQDEAAGTLLARAPRSESSIARLDLSSARSSSSGLWSSR